MNNETTYLLTKNIPVVNEKIYATYADKAIKNLPILIPLYKGIKEMLKIRFQEWVFDWKEEYEEVFNDEKFKITTERYYV